MNSCTEALWDEPIMVKVNKLAEAAAMMERRDWQIVTAAGNEDAADYYRNEYRREKELKNQIYKEICNELRGNSGKPRERADGGLTVLRERAVLTDRIQTGDRIAISITRRSRPKASPPCGGVPYWNASSMKPNFCRASSSVRPMASKTFSCNSLL